MLNPKVQYILQTLISNGYEAYVVGGAVRDLIMGNEPHDYDITTNARPEQIKACFEKTVDTGIKHGTVTVMLDGEGFEVTTYRCDGKYSDGRHPDDVTFVDDIKADLARRDFTINAMAMDIDGNIIDPFGGQEDIADECIRCVGDPAQRFNEDALRMLRAVRFVAQFDFTLDDDTDREILRSCHDLRKVSAERIREEFTKMLMAKYPRYGFIEAYRTHITAMVLPEFDAMKECEQNNPAHYADVGIHTLDTISFIEVDPILRWAALLHDSGKPATKYFDEKAGKDRFSGHPEVSAKIAEDVLTRLKFSNADKAEIVELVKYHDYVATHDSKIRVFAAQHSRDFIIKLNKLKIADTAAHVADKVAKYQADKDYFISKALEFIDDGTAVLPKDLNINGNTLLELGFTGPEIGKFYDYVYMDCMAEPKNNTEERLIKRAKKFLEKQRRTEMYKQNQEK